MAERAREHVQQMTKQLGEKQKDQRAAGRERERDTETGTDRMTSKTRFRRWLVSSGISITCKLNMIHSL